MELAFESIRVNAKVTQPVDVNGKTQDVEGVK